MFCCGCEWKVFSLPVLSDVRKVQSLKVAEPERFSNSRPLFTVCVQFHDLSGCKPPCVQ